MKKLFIYLLCTFTSSIFAQKNITTSEEFQKPNWNILLSKLDTTQINSGVLIDKTTSFANLIFFNTINHNISSYNHFKQGLSELHRASNKSLFVNTTNLVAKIKSNSGTNEVMVGIVNANFEKLNLSQTSTRTGGVRFVNGVFEPIAGRKSFLTRKFLMAAPLQSAISGNKVVFKFANNLVFSNATSGILSLQISFDDGQPAIEVIKNNSVILPQTERTYNTFGTKKLVFNVTFSDGLQLTTAATIAVLRPIATVDLCSEPLKVKGRFNSSIAFKGYNEPFEVYGKIDYATFYSTGNNQKRMIKPIIIIDGFDPGDERKIQDCDCEQDKKCRELEAHLTDGNFNPNKHDSIEESMFYLDGTINPITGLPRTGNLLSELRDLGYDVIIINNPSYIGKNTAGQDVAVDGGADFIERNGRNLASFIKDFVKVKQSEVGSIAPLVLMGPSMGGQITRYALAYMEKKEARATTQTDKDKWKNNARLWVSVDSPHLGANVPVAVQANV